MVGFSKKPGYLGTPPPKFVIFIFVFWYVYMAKHLWGTGSGAERTTCIGGHSLPSLPYVVLRAPKVNLRGGGDNSPKMIKNSPGLLGFFKKPSIYLILAKIGPQYM